MKNLMRQFFFPTPSILSICIFLAASAMPVFAQNYSSLKIVPPPGGGLYLGQYEWQKGDIATFEAAIGKKVALWSPENVMSYDGGGRPVFDPAAAEAAWQQGRVEYVYAFEANPAPGLHIPGFTVDKLLNGVYDAYLIALAGQFKQFAKPMFFETAREPNGVGSDYFGGFGPQGDKSFDWAVANQRGLDEFDPSGFPDAGLYADLGDPNTCDGLERLIAAQRYYYDFFVNRMGLDFLTFDTMGWAAIPMEKHRQYAIDDGASPYEIQLIESCFDFKNFYPGDAYVDWVSLNWYMLDYYSADHDWTDVDYIIPISDYLADLSAVMGKVRAVAPGKSVLFMELGLPDGRDQNSWWAAEKVNGVLMELLTRYPEINGFAMWSFHPSWASYFPWDSLIRPDTHQGDVFKQWVQLLPSAFHSCVYFSDGSIMPNCP